MSLYSSVYQFNRKVSRNGHHSTIPFERSRCMMTRFLLAVTILCYALTSIALSTDVPENSSRGGTC